jgi:anti-sigma factor RsiW
MKCEDVRRYVGPYLDSELDPKTSFEIARHLEACPDCKGRVEAEGRLERAVARELARPQAGDDALWERALARARASRPRRWRRAGLASGGLAAAGVLAWLLAFGGNGLAADLRKDYWKYARGDSPLELSSADPREVEAFFKDRMGLSVPVPVPAGWELRGGRKCSLRGIPTAFLLYRLRDRDVTAYVFPGDHLDRFREARALHDPLMDEAAEVRVAAIRSGPHVVGAAGAVHCRELLALCRAFGN